MNEDLTIKVIAGVAVVIIPAIMAVVSSIFRKRWERPNYPAEGELLMRYNMPFRLLGVYAAFVSPSMICAIGVVAPPRGLAGIIAACGCLVLFIGVGLPIFVESQYRWLLVSPEGIISHSPWRQDRVYAWADFVEAICPLSNPFIVLRGRDGRKVKLYAHFTGRSEFLTFLIRYANPTVCAQAQPGIMRMGLLFTPDVAAPFTDVPETNPTTEPAASGNNTSQQIRSATAPICELPATDSVRLEPSKD